MQKTKITMPCEFMKLRTKYKAPGTKEPEWEDCRACRNIFQKYLQFAHWKCKGVSKKKGEN